METKDRALQYIPRIRDYYLALGYETPYRWAQNITVPFAPLSRKLSDCHVAIVTTAAPFKPGAGEQGPGAPYNGAAKFYTVYDVSSDPAPDLRISHIAYDRTHTTAEDIDSYFPLRQLQKLASEGLIGSVCKRVFGLPTNRSHRTTVEIDGPELVKRMKIHSVDIGVLVPNCPVCHQSVSLAATQLETAGISTVVMGCAKDIVEYVGAPRFLFSDFPLGNSAGKPHDQVSQYKTLSMALNLVDELETPGITVQSPQQWCEDSSWKEDYCSLRQLDEQQLQQRRLEFDKQKRRAKKS